MPNAGLKTIIALSFVLAVGFLLVIPVVRAVQGVLPAAGRRHLRAGALPNWICGRWSNPDDFVESSGNAVLRPRPVLHGLLGRHGNRYVFSILSPRVCAATTPCRWGFLYFGHEPLGWKWPAGWTHETLTLNSLALTFANACIAAALPVVLAHSNIIEVPAMVMCIVGGLLIYGTIISFGMSFQDEQEF
ncbi:hypothetical protein NUW58_g5642 [Xylaria curta]|uniref:Uncharacterized protein n=1 Tax=Xylaria curta TaxID=42375 RepID=A0ACC1P2V6_9PEZI|nr:hypothetical protein NUW58_g5642 [Xylaria curta]